MEIEANEENALESEETIQDIKIRMETLEENYQLLMNNLTEQFTTMNSATVEVSEKMETTNDLIAENSMTVLLSVGIALAVYNFVNQISKW